MITYDNINDNTILLHLIIGAKTKCHTTALQLLGQQELRLLLSFPICTEMHSVAKILANEDLVIWINWVIAITNSQNLMLLPLKLVAKLPPFHNPLKVLLLKCYGLFSFTLVFTNFLKILSAL